MKRFFALPVLLRVVLASRSFSVLEDLLAFPQYSVSISDAFLTESHASALLRGERGLPPESRDESGSPEAEFQPDHTRSTLEELVLNGQRYLCSIPDVPLVNSTDDSAKAKDESGEAALELARATNRGWELLKGMQGNCIYFFGGWWSYSFCFNEGVKQFHQLPPGRNAPVWPPVEDKGVDSYMLGRYVRGGDKVSETDDHTHVEAEPGPDVEVGLETKGETRYLVQKLSGGTICDLTGKERKIEVQFHCHPTSSDRIALIKETSTCAYLMVIYTPRLCNDVAFLPPKVSIPHEIHCRGVVPASETHAWDEARRRKEEYLITQGGSILNPEGADGPNRVLNGVQGSQPTEVVGGTRIGARRLIPSGVSLKRSGVVGGKPLETFIATLASSANPDERLSPAQLKRLKIHDAQAVEKLKRDLRKLAGTRGWKLEVVDTVIGREVRGVIEEGRKEDEQDDGESERLERHDETDDGSEETYKEEL